MPSFSARCSSFSAKAKMPQINGRHFHERRLRLRRRPEDRQLKLL